MDRNDEKTIDDVARQYRRYDVEAYRFMFEALDYLLGNLGERRHVSGVELAAAVRELALERFGFMARTVLNEWNVHSTADLGEIVFHLVTEGLMSKTDDDSKSDFADLYDFEDALDRGYLWETPREDPKNGPRN